MAHESRRFLPDRVTAPRPKPRGPVGTRPGVIRTVPPAARESRLSGREGVAGGPGQSADSPHGGFSDDECRLRGKWSVRFKKGRDGGGRESLCPVGAWSALLVSPPGVV